nr:hypothetical protein B0A51_13923 [Rachicladosporium sp. CCFEE 5018]
MESPTPSSTAGGGTPARDSKPLIQICNRCIPYMDEDMDQYTCGTTFGMFKRKCPRCVRQRHACEPTDAPLIPALNALVRARTALSNQTAGGDDPDAPLLRTARAAQVNLTTSLRTFDRNRNQVTGDRRTPRKRSAAVAFAGSNEASTLEMQSLRRIGLAGGEIGKIGLRLAGASEEDIASVDALLGPDGPADVEEDEEEE